MVSSAGYAEETFLYLENHAFDAWFKKAYGDKEEKETPCYTESAVGQLHKQHSREDIQ